MRESTGDNYISSEYAKALAASDAKVGKTTFLVCSMLGALPWQKFGGVVDKPDNLHVITFDANALGGLKGFILDRCKRSKDYLRYNVYNLQDEFKAISQSRDDWNYDLYNAVMNTLDIVNSRVAKTGGVHALIFSSVTGLAEGILRAVAGPPDPGNKGSGMDPSKWQALAAQLVDIRNRAQTDTHHCIWEAHIDRAPSFAMKKKGQDDDTGPKESIHVPGSAGRSWSFNMEQVFRIRREYGGEYENTGVDMVYLDTRPSGSFISNGRAFNELLKPREADMTVAFHKLGLNVGRYGSKKKSEK
jgi:hypothetical protein